MGVAVGDAVGVPFEFKKQRAMAENPCTDMSGYGTYNLPPGTWSDDTSLTLCLAEALLEGYHLPHIARQLTRWFYEQHWTARGEVFDIGISTRRAMRRLSILLEEGAEEALYNQLHRGSELENGNGSLMRILPLLFEIRGLDPVDQYRHVCEVSALTHRHERAAMSCFIYLRMAEKLLDGQEKNAAYRDLQREMGPFWEQIDFTESERAHFKLLIEQDVRLVPEEAIRTDGYVIHSLQASFWYFLQGDNYKDTILAVINRGDDTDTSAAITGGLAGLYYGVSSIPGHWVAQLARREAIEDLCTRLAVHYGI